MSPRRRVTRGFISRAWQLISANQAIALTEYFLNKYNTDSHKIYGSAYYGGGLFPYCEEITEWLFSQEWGNLR